MLVNPIGEGFLFSLMYSKYLGFFFLNWRIVDLQCCISFNICESNKNDTKELIYKTETNSDFKTNLTVTTGEIMGGGRKELGRVGITYTHYCIK